MHTNTLFRRSLLLLLLLTLLFSFCNCSSLFRDPIHDISKDGSLLPENAVLSPCDDCIYAAEHLEHWGFPAFQINKAVYVEKAYNDYYYKALPDSYELAKTIYENYRLYGSGRIDENDPLIVTETVISLYQMAVGDIYAVYLNKEATEDYIENMNSTLVGIGVHLLYDRAENTCLITDVMKDTPAQAAGILAGDYLIGAADKTLAADGYETVANAVRGQVGTPVSVTVLRQGQEITFKIVREQIIVSSVSYRMLAETAGLACIRIEQFNTKTAAQFKEAVDAVLAAGATGIIFDVRDNPGGDVNAVTGVLDYLLPDGEPLAHFRYRPDSVVAAQSKTIVARDGHSVELPFAVLCNEGTASAGELFTAALHDYEAAVIIGETTYGKGTAQTVLSLSDGTLFTVSIATYDPPYGENYEGSGIAPDLTVTLPQEVAATPYATRHDGDDDQLQAAIAQLAVTPRA